MRLSFVIIFLVCNSSQNCNGQLLETLKKSENTQRKLFYVDKGKNSYQTEIIAGVEMNVIFKQVIFLKSKSTFLIKGSTITPTIGDTVGLCCIEFFLARTKGDSLYKKRNLGRTNSKDFNPKAENGYFLFETKISKGDKLFFCGDSGGNLKEFFVDRLLTAK